MSNYHNPPMDPEVCRACPCCSMMIRVKRWQYHLMKCKKVHPEIKLFTCPFNASHVFPKAEERHHIANCDDKGIIERNIVFAQQIKPGRAELMGYCKVPDYNTDWMVNGTDDWDEEATAPSFGVEDQVTRHRASPPQTRQPMREPRNLPNSLRQHLMKESDPANEKYATALHALARGRGTIASRSVAAEEERRPGSLPNTISIGRGRGTTTEVPEEVHNVPCEYARPVGRGISNNNNTKPFCPEVNGHISHTPQVGISSGSHGQVSQGIGRGIGRGIMPIGRQVNNNSAFTLNGYGSDGSDSSARSSPARNSPATSMGRPVNQSNFTLKGVNGSGPSFVVPKIPIKTSNSQQTPDHRASSTDTTGSGSSGEEVLPRDFQKESRKLRKKLKAIESLERRIQTGDQLTCEEKEKLTNKRSFEEELARLSVEN